MNNLGKKWEIEAANYLRKKKYKIIAANYHSRFGEIDLIAEHKGFICFIEVKQRDISSIALPREFVDAVKQNKLSLTASQYIANNYVNLQPRFDVIEIYTENNKIKSIKHLENAFEL